MKLGSFISDLPLSEEEFQRLASLLDSDKILLEILQKYGPLRVNKTRKVLAKEFKLKGINDPNLLMKRVIDFLKIGMIGDRRKNQYLREFYGYCFVSYLVDEKPKIQNYMKIAPIGSSSSTFDILKKMIDASEKVGVSLEDIYFLYKYWWFKRMSPDEENTLFKELLVKKENHYSKDSSKEVTEDYVNLVENKVNQYSREIKNSIKELKKEIKALKGTDKETEKKCKDLFKNIETINLSLSETAKSQDLGAIKQGVKKWDDKIRSLEHRIKKEIQDADRSFRSLVSSGQEEIQNKFLENTIEHQKLIDEKIKEVVENEKRKFFEVDFRPVWLEQVEGKREHIAQEEVFLGTWKDYLSSRYDIYLTDEQVVIYHTFLKCMNYSIFSELQILESWIEMLGFEEQTFVESTNPLWTRRLDWIGLSSHLEDQSKARKLGIMKDFDTAIVGAYLVPQISRWCGSSIQDSMHLFLIPSENNPDKMNFNEVVNIAGLFQKEFFPEVTSSRKLPNHKFDLNKYMPRVQEKNFKKWILEPEETIFRKELVDTPEKSLEIKIPEEVLKNFNKLYINLKPYLIEASAKRVAISLSLEPYIRTCYGNEMLGKYIDFVMVFL